MSVAPEPHERDTVPYMAGALVCGRKNKLWERDVLSLFSFIKTSVLSPAACSCRSYLAHEIFI